MNTVYRYTLLSFVLIMSLSACMPAHDRLPVHDGTIKQMTEIGHEQVGLVPNKGSVIVVFVRPKDAISAFQFALFEIGSLSADPKLIGILAANTSAVYETHPGKHLFMSTGHASQADFITADLLPDATYYVLVDGQISKWGPYRVFLRPPEMAGLSTADMKVRFDESRVVLKSLESEQWSSDNMQNIRLKLETFSKKLADGQVPHLKSQND
jgi:hypothetical protein